MKRLLILLTAVASLAVASVAVSGSALAAPPSPGVNAPPGQGKILCFNDSPATCTLNSNGAKGTATLDTSSGGAAGVYIPGYNDSFYNVSLAAVRDLSFRYTGVGGIDPRWSIPIDTDGNGSTDLWAYVAAGTCNNGAGLVDVIRDTTCTIYRSDNALASYDNWAAFAAAMPTASVISFADYAFVIADSSQGVWTVGNVTVGKPGK